MEEWLRSFRVYARERRGACAADKEEILSCTIHTLAKERNTHICHPRRDSLPFCHRRRAIDKTVVYICRPLAFRVDSSRSGEYSRQTRRELKNRRDKKRSQRRYLAATRVVRANEERGKLVISLLAFFWPSRRAVRSGELVTAASRRRLYLREG